MVAVIVVIVVVVIVVTVIVVVAVVVGVVAVVFVIVIVVMAVVVMVVIVVVVIVVVVFPLIKYSQSRDPRLASLVLCDTHDLNGNIATKIVHSTRTRELFGACCLNDFQQPRYDLLGAQVIARFTEDTNQMRPANDEGHSIVQSPLTPSPCPHPWIHWGQGRQGCLHLREGLCLLDVPAPLDLILLARLAA